ncbi:MAG: 50S ribosomal protein L28 [Candidatus Paceibacterota bacterium]
MSRACQVCGRGTRSSQSRSHSNIATKRKQFINVQKRSIDGETIKICTKCLKTKSKNKLQ